ncbi:CxxH/CxxC protein [Pseudalkalibacillus salsuginis]|uniref:CxxH/CxxC protein n=1 Tax=Pseudalkalibacillus salsuginis TaxID=2910972 RepID=UPI001F1B3228|nr:CxxH/CxxC protein [Pseudalkalibacillus salsuginis]MCF6410739.1 CxxH/CxxC protein [Pseudalkalibacillus salsuginis]
MIVCCKEHVELALEVIVDEYETAPEMKELTEAEKLSTICEYCKNNAIYMVSN